MGVVYRARDTKLDRDVALKFLPAHLAASEQDKARFVQEAKAAAARASWRNLAATSFVAETCDGKNFSATSRSSFVSRARYTTPIPPSPSFWRIR